MNTACRLFSQQERPYGNYLDCAANSAILMSRDRQIRAALSQPQKLITFNINGAMRTVQDRTVYGSRAGASVGATSVSWAAACAHGQGRSHSRAHQRLCRVERNAVSLLLSAHVTLGVRPERGLPPMLACIAPLPPGLVQLTGCSLTGSALYSHRERGCPRMIFGQDALAEQQKLNSSSTAAATGKHG